MEPNCSNCRCGESDFFPNCGDLKVKVFAEKHYEIDDFIDRMKRKEVMPV